MPWFALALLLLACGDDAPHARQITDKCTPIIDRYEELLRSAGTWGLAGHGPGLTSADLELYRLRNKECF